jgi:hypothetical protein
MGEKAMSAISRRDVLTTDAGAATVALSAGAASAAVALGDPDAELLALEKQLNQAIARWKEASAIQDDFDEQLQAMKPVRPEPISPPKPAEFAGCERTTVAELDFLHRVVREHPVAVWWKQALNSARDRDAGAWNAYRTECERIDEDFGGDARRAYEVQRAFLEETDELGRQILSTTSLSFTGLGVKARLLAHFDTEVDREDVLEAIVANIERLAAGGQHV